MNKLNLSDNIIRLRHEKKLTQEELAVFLGVTKASVSKWEKGIHAPDILLLPQLAAFFDVTVDELIGYKSQLTKEQIRRQYAELSSDFANLPFEDALEHVRAAARRYYACYPMLLQLSILYWNHCMLAETKKERDFLLQEAVGWCDRILENCSDISILSDALEVKAGLCLAQGKAQEAVQQLEPPAESVRLAGQQSSLLIQAYQMAGETEKARNYVQIKQYLDLLNLTGDTILSLSLHQNDIGQCEESMRRIRGLIKLYHLESLHPNLTAQFYYQCAVIYALNEKETEALKQLHCFEKCVDKLLNTQGRQLHGDEYFPLIDAWIDRLPLGSMAPRDKRFIIQSLEESFAHPAFLNIKKTDEFQHMERRLKKSCEEYARKPDSQADNYGNAG